MLSLTFLLSLPALATLMPFAAESLTHSVALDSWASRAVAAPATSFIKPVPRFPTNTIRTSKNILVRTNPPLIESLDRLQKLKPAIKIKGLSTTTPSSKSIFDQLLEGYGKSSKEYKEMLRGLGVSDTDLDLVLDDLHVSTTAAAAKNVPLKIQENIQKPITSTGVPKGKGPSVDEAATIGVIPPPFDKEFEKVVVMGKPNPRPLAPSSGGIKKGSMEESSTIGGDIFLQSRDKETPTTLLVAEKTSKKEGKNPVKEVGKKVKQVLDDIGRGLDEVGKDIGDSLLGPQRPQPQMIPIPIPVNEPGMHPGSGLGGGSFRGWRRK